MSENGSKPRPWGTILFFVLLVAAVVQALPGLAALSPSTFEGNDGNLVVDGASAKDWANVGIDCTASPKVGCAIDTPTGQSDDSFGAAKEDSPVPALTTGSIPNNKSDLTRFYITSEAAGSKLFLALGWERVQDPSGTTNMDFELNRSSQVSSNGVTPVRSPGDVLLKYDLSKGGTSPSLGYHRWVSADSAPAGATAKQVCEAASAFPCWDKLHAIDNTKFEASINGGQVVDPIAPDAPRTLSARTFGEAVVNLTDSGIVPSGSCMGFAQAYLKSRSADAFTADLKDFIAPIPAHIDTCGTIIVRKQTDPDGAAGSFGFNTTGGLTPATFNLSDDGVRTYTGVTPGTYTIRETPGSGFDLSDLVCTPTGSGTSATPSLTTATASITLAASGVVDCTFTNTRRGRILVDKVTAPAGSAASFAFTLSGGPSSLSQAFSLTDAAAPFDSGAILPGSGYAVAETLPAGWDQMGATCSNGSPVNDVTVAPGETVTCTFTNTQRGGVAIHKVDDANNALSGAVFTLYVNNAPTAGPRGAEDTATALTCTTGADGNCTIPGVLPGGYWVVETTVPGSHDPAPDQAITVVAGVTTAPLTFVDPRQHRIIVLVCHEGTNTLTGSAITLGATTKQSLDGTGLTLAQQAALCGTGGASFGGVTGHDAQTLTVDPVNH